jgi:hypothetical protein
MKHPLQTRLAVALGCYAVLAGVAAYALDGALRIVILIFFAGLVLRTISAAHRMDEEK